MIHDVTDLEVYKSSLTLLEETYILLRKIPLSEKDSIYQIKRAAKSIPANIAEGFAKRNSTLEFKRFLRIALGSSDEVITHLRTLSIALPRLAQNADNLLKEYKILSKRINVLHSKWRLGQL